MESLTQGVIRGDLDGAGHHLAESLLVVQVSACEGVRLEGLIELQGDE